MTRFRVPNAILDLVAAARDEHSRPKHNPYSQGTADKGAAPTELEMLTFECGDIDMQSDWILTKSLWMLNVGGSALVVWRLYSAGLHRTYRFFFASMILTLARSVALLPFTPRSESYYRIWSTTQPLSVAILCISYRRTLFTGVEEISGNLLTRTLVLLHRCSHIRHLVSPHRFSTIVAPLLIVARCSITMRLQSVE